MHNHLSKLRVINEELYLTHVHSSNPVIYTLLGVSKGNIMHKPVAGVLTDDGLKTSIIALFKEGSYLIDLAKSAIDMDFRIIIHTIDGILLADMANIKDIYACYKEACEEAGFGTPPPLIERVNKPLTSFPFNPKNIKS